MPEEKLNSARVNVERALKERKVFTIIGGYKPVRKGLRRRNYIEKVAEKNSHKKTSHTTSSTNQDEHANEDRNDDDDDDGSGSELDFSSDSEDDCPELKNFVVSHPFC